MCSSDLPVCRTTARAVPAAPWNRGYWPRLKRRTPVRRPTKSRLVARLAGVEPLRRDLRRRNDGHLPPALCVEKATAPPGVAVDPLLVDEEQKGVPSHTGRR